MNRCVREPAPEFLESRCGRWTEAYELGLAEDAPRGFMWPSCDGEPLNRKLLPILRAMTAEHCSYCDGFPLGSFARETIDHFRPKGMFPKLVFQWPNLFLACDVCQREKRANFDERWLKPDEADYSFERYFVFDFRTGEVGVNPAASPEDQARALATIDGFGLNRSERPVTRRRELRSRSQLELHERPYRYALSQQSVGS